MDNVVILGAGLAGLGCARTLAGARVFEAEEYPGGHAYSQVVGPVAFDQGAHICHSKKPDFLELIYKQARGVHQIEPSIVVNYWRGQWVTFPVQNHLHELPLDKRIPALTDLIMAHVNQSGQEPANYAQWCLSQYGQYLTENFYRVFTEKYWRMDMEELATDWLSGRLLPSVLQRIIPGAFTEYTDSQASFTRFHYPARGGFFGFFKPLYDGLDIYCGQRAVEVNLSTKTITFASGRKEYYEFLANSIPLPRLVEAIPDAPASVREAAKTLCHTKLLCVNMILNRPNLAKCHWCYIYDHEIEPARVSFPSNLSPTSAEGGISALQAEVFRRNDEDWDVGALTEQTVKQMAAVFGFNPSTELVSVTSLTVPYAYVISDLSRQSAVDHIIPWLREHDVFSMGLYGIWKYLWSDFAYYSGVETAKKIMAQTCRK